MTPLHERLDAAATRLSSPRVSLQHLAAAHGQAAQGTMLVLLSSACLVPIPGVGTLLGLGIATLALAIWKGQTTTALPDRVGRLEVSAQTAQRILALLARFYRLASRWSCARCSALAPGSPGSWQAGFVALMAALIILPLPFGNVLPALALILFGLGVVFRDGFAVIAALAISSLAVLFAVGMVWGAWALGSTWLSV